MAMTTQTIIEILPLEKEFKDKVLSEWDQLTDDQRFNMEQLLWDAYAELYDIKYDENEQTAFLRVQDNEDNFDKDFYKRIREKTNEDMSHMTSQHATSEDLSNTREQLSKILDQAPTQDEKQPSN
jgi:hypothetical protein